MNKLYYLAIGLVLSILGISLFLIKWISQGQYCRDGKDVYKFVVAEDGKYCYIEWHHNSAISVRAKFSDLKECEAYLYTHLR